MIMLDHHQTDLPSHPISVIFENHCVTENLLMAVILQKAMLCAGFSPVKQTWRSIMYHLSLVESYHDKTFWWEVNFTDWSMRQALLPTSKWYFSESNVAYKAEVIKHDQAIQSHDVNTNSSPLSDVKKNNHIKKTKSLNFGTVQRLKNFTFYRKNLSKEKILNSKRNYFAENYTLSYTITWLLFPYSSSSSWVSI